MDKPRKPSLVDRDFALNPFIVIWEVTRACALRCVHCRAEAIPRRDPYELSREEGFRLIDQICILGHPLFVLTGGDPMRHPHTPDFIEYAAQRGLRVGLTPSAVPSMTKKKVELVKARGLSRMAISLDGSTPAIHDAFRQVPGSYDWTRRIIQFCHEVELPVQINTTITRHNLPDLSRLGDLMQRLNPVLWGVFFLVPTGRGKVEDEITAEEYEQVFHYLYDLSKIVSFDIKTTAAPQYRRVVIQRQRQETLSASTAGPGFQTLDGIGRAKGVNDGNGFVFISHRGEVFPSGFLPLSAGNIRQNSLVDIYRHAPLFRELRDYTKLKGKCGYCEFKWVCGGSRARAYAMTGDYLAEDPFCAYKPSSSHS